VKDASTLDGHWEVKVKRKVGRFEYVVVAPDWAARNFKKSVLGLAQRVAYEKLEVMEDGQNHLTRTQKTGYVQVETPGVTSSKVDKRVINRLKYKRGFDNVPSQWMGYSNATKAHIQLFHPWVKKNFPAAYITQVMTSSGPTNSYIKVPPGDNRKHTETSNLSYPKIHYQQKEDERTCMVYAMASVLHHYGRTNDGAWVRNRAKRYLNDPNAFRSFVKDIRKHIKGLKQISKMDKHFDLLGVDLSGIYLIQIKGSDGKEDHCVVVTKDWIFDSNFKNALPRTQQSLDMCCSSDKVKSTFVSYVQIEHFPNISTS
jgi:hypothetical protein